MDCPYDTLPASSWWQESAEDNLARRLNPHTPQSLAIGRQTRIGSAGSCFAEHMARSLVARGYNYFVTEEAPAFLTPAQAAQYQYGVYSARYGNIYSALQLAQMIRRAFGNLQTVDQFWQDDSGRCFDLLRPRIMPNGFASRNEAEADSRQHLGAVRELFTKAEVFIFTLGMTEAWVSAEDGIAYPTCPGCGSAGEYDKDRYLFKNLSASETSEFMAEAIGFVTAVNPDVQFILTVSPVPLIATMEPRHVLQATTYSKSVLRVAAEEMVRGFDNVHYFGSYEIVTATASRDNFFKDDLRTMLDSGVQTVMDSFFELFAADEDIGALDVPTKGEKEFGTNLPGEETVMCDEEEFFRRLTARRG